MWELVKSRGLVFERADADGSCLDVNYEFASHKAVIPSKVLSHTETMRLYGKFRRYRFFHNIVTIWRHPMLADLPRYVFKLLREKIRRIGRRTTLIVHAHDRASVDGDDLYL